MRNLKGIACTPNANVFFNHAGPELKSGNAFYHMKRLNNSAKDPLSWLLFPSRSAWCGIMKNCLIFRSSIRFGWNFHDITRTERKRAKKIWFIEIVWRNRKSFNLSFLASDESATRIARDDNNSGGTRAQLAELMYKAHIKMKLY